MSESEFPDSIEQAIDSMAENVPVDRRAAFYRDMGYLRVLPKSDEMLHILMVIGWNTVIMVQVPARIAAEIKKLEQIFREQSEAQQRIYERLDRVFDELVQRVSAETIANQLYESLRQQFVETMIPQTGLALTAVAKRIDGVVGRLEQDTPKIMRAHKHVVSETMAAIGEIKSEISAVTATARQATSELSRTLVHQYRWAVGLFVVVALILGLLLGIHIDRSGFLPR